MVGGSLVREVGREVTRVVREHPHIHIDWTVVQNDALDRVTMPFSIYSFGQLKHKILSLQDPFDRQYCLCRWFRYWCARNDEECFVEAGAVPNPDVRDRRSDFTLLGIPFDLKSTRMPDGADKKDREGLLKWFYTNQSSGVRFGYQNRLFLVHNASTREEENLKRVDFGGKGVVIRKYVDAMGRGGGRFVRLEIGGAEVITDLIVF